MLNTLVFLPFAIQGLLMFFDEFHYHHRRGLPKWERIGHPVDTTSVLLCFLWINFVSFSESNLIIFMVLSFLSCVLVTKDEFVHHALCDSKEQWLHSMLFIIHPIVFISAGYLWFVKENNAFAKNFLTGQVFIVISVLLYQIIYWNLIRKEAADERN